MRCVLIIVTQSCRGRLLRSTCDFAAAEEDFERILELKPSHKGAAKELGLLQKGRRALEEAVANKYSIFSTHVITTHHVTYVTFVSMHGAAAPNSMGMLLLLLSLLAGMQKHSHANIMMLLGFTSCMQ